MNNFVRNLQTLFLATAILLAPAATAQAGDADIVCDGLTGAAFGLCTAAVNVGCGEDGTASTGCTKIEEKYEQITGERPPWTSSFLCKRTGAYCGGIAGIPCAENQFCADDPSDNCYSGELGNADCAGVCIVGTPDLCPRVATVSPLSPYFNRFEGLEGYFPADLDNVCESDANAVAAGCSDEVCSAEPGIPTTCEALDEFPIGDCICIDGETQWGIDAVLQE
jgi:hypothetical protein